MDVPPGPKERRREERCLGLEEGRFTAEIGAVEQVSYLWLSHVRYMEIIRVLAVHTLSLAVCF